MKVIEDEEDWESFYHKIVNIGKGAFGTVFKAKLIKDPSKLVAIKKLKLDNENEGIPSTTMREIAIMSYLDHPNVLK